MKKEAFNRAVAKVRDHLSLYLGDEDKELLTQLAGEHEVSVRSLRKFAEGDDTALAKPVVAVWSRLLGSNVFANGTSTADLMALMGITSEVTNSSRLARLDQYDMIEDTRSECDRGLTVWSDTVIYGSSGDTDRYGGGFEAHPVAQNESFRIKLEDISYRINNLVLPDAEKHKVTRDVVKYGEHFEQIGLGKAEDGNTHVTALAPLSIRQTQILHNHPSGDRYGLFLPGQIAPYLTFPDWKVIQFASKKSRNDEHGRSQFQSLLRSWVQVEAMEAGIIIRRLERSGQKKKWTVDTSGCANDKEALKLVLSHRDANKKRKTVDMNQNLDRQRISIPDGDDLFVGRKSKDAAGDVENLEGDQMIGEINDFSHFFNKFLTGLGPPKFYLGYEQDTQRSVATELAVNFARMARRIQGRIIQGLNQLYWIELILLGIDPRKARYTIFAPPLGTRDELIRAQIMSAKSLAVMNLSKAFGSTGKQPSTEWFLRYFNIVDDEAIAALDLATVIGKGNTAKTTDPKPKESVEIVAHLLNNRRLRSEVDYTRLLLNEAAMSKMSPEQYEKIWRNIGVPLLPTMDVAQCARDLWIPELHAA